MRLFSKVFVAVMVTVAVAAAPEASAQRNRNNNQSAAVMIVDVGRVIESSNIGRDMQTKLQQIYQQMQAEIAPEVQALQTEAQSLQQATQGMSQDQINRNSSLMARVNAFAQRREQVSARGETMQRDFEYTRQRTYADFSTQITPTVREVMTSRGAGVVLDAANVSLFQPNFNATDDVVQLLNQRLQTMNVTRQAAPAQQQIGAAPGGQ